MLTYSPLNKDILINCITPITYSNKLLLNLTLGDYILILKEILFSYHHPVVPPVAKSRSTISKASSLNSDGLPRHSNESSDQRQRYRYQDPADIMQRHPVTYAAGANSKDFLRFCKQLKIILFSSYSQPIQQQNTQTDFSGSWQLISLLKNHLQPNRYL